jgi:AGCS family alanine or glycine:cation symporter
MSAAIERFLARAVDIAWGPPLVLLVVGGGLALSFYARFLPLFRIGHALRVLRGDFDDEADPGQISHFQALSTALASTIGVGNIGGVAVAITQGGPGAIFWMWIAGVVGMATKFFTCTLAVMFRGHDSAGQLQGGPMYYIEQGLGPRFRPLAVAFAVFGLVGCLPIFQTNQMAEILDAAYGVPGWLTGALAVAFVVAVAWGGVERIGHVASRLVPFMCLLYVGSCLWVLVVRVDQVPEVFARILHDAFNGTAATGGAAGIAVSTVIRIGVRRAAFSNEAGIGTAPLAHGAAKTGEPVREGLIAMLGPFIDTIVVCSLTAFVILTSGLSTSGGVQGVSLTGQAFEAALEGWGGLLLTAAVVLFGASTMVGYSYYGRKCFGFLFGAPAARNYDLIYLVGLFLGAIWSAPAAVNLVDTTFAMMALPNMIAALLLAPRVMEATRDYFARMKSGEGG